MQVGVVTRRHFHFLSISQAHDERVKWPLGDAFVNLFFGHDCLSPPITVLSIKGVQGHRSTSPRTMSTLPRITTTSATMWPRHMSSRIVRLMKLGGRTR